MRKHFTALLLVLLMGSVGGCPPPLDAAGQAQLSHAEELFAASDYHGAAAVLTRFLQEHGSSRQAARAFYLRGLCQRRIDPPDNAAARADLQQAVQKASTAALRGLAQAALGHTFFEANTPQGSLAAAAHYRAALRDLADAPPKDAVLYRLAVSLQKLGRWAEADRYLSRCLNEFPDSGLAAAARQRFGARSFRLQVGAFSELDRALREAARLKAAGWPADWSAVLRQGRPLYVVRTGSYQEYAQARAAQQAIASVQPDTLIVAVAPGAASDDKGGAHD